MSDAFAPFRHRLTVRFRDCDLMGHVNHAVYLTYFEQCRFAWWRHLGGTMGFPGATTLIVHAECDYRAPAFLNDELEIALSLTAIGRTSVTLAYTVHNVATGQRLAEGKTVNVTVDSDTHVPIPVPAASRALLNADKLGGQGR